MTPLNTERLTLLPATIPHLQALMEGHDHFWSQFGYRVVDGYLDFPDALPFSLQALWSGLASPEWWTYLFLHKAERALIGIGGYKGAPCDGVAEIGYCIAPAFRGQGYATEATGALVRHAFAQPDVEVVRAHTLAELNASNSVLDRCGLAKVSAFTDTEAGEVWRWEIRKGA